MKPGWKTSEFWLTGAVAALAFLATTGVISGGDQVSLEKAVRDAAVQLGGLLASACVVWKYIIARTHLKVADVPAEPLPVEPPPSSPPSPPAGVLLPVLLALGLFGLGGVASAQEADKHEVFLRGRIRALELRLDLLSQQKAPAAPATDPALLAIMQQLLQQQQMLQQQMLQPQRTPAAPQIVERYYYGPLQQLSPEGAPKQQLNPEGAPKQQLSPEGAPKQQLSPEGAPKQQLDPGGAPKQQLSPQGPPRQQLSPEGAPGQRLVGPPVGYQRYTTAIYRGN